MSLQNAVNRLHASTTIPSIVAGTEPWAGPMLAVIKTVLKQVDNGLSGMGSEDGYLIDKKEVSAPVKAFKKANFKVVEKKNSYEVPSGKKGKGVYMQLDEDMGEWILSWYDESLT